MLEKKENKMKKIISVVVVVAVFLVIEVAQAATIFVPVSNISRAEAIRIGEIANENGGMVVSFECSKHGTLVFIRNKRENARSFFSLGREEIIHLLITLDGKVSTGPSEWALKIRKEVQEIIK